MGTLNSLLGFPGGSDGKESACNSGYPGSTPGSERSPGEGNDNALRYSCLENPMDRGAWWVTAHGVTTSQIMTKRLNNKNFLSPPKIVSMKNCSARIGAFSKDPQVMLTNASLWAPPGLDHPFCRPELAQQTVSWVRAEEYLRGDCCQSLRTYETPETMQNMGEIPLKFGGQGQGNYLQCPGESRCAALPGWTSHTWRVLAGRLWPLTLAEVELGVPAPRLLESSKLEAAVSKEGCPVLASTEPLALSPLPCSWPGVPGTGRRCGHHKDCSLLWRQTQPALRHQPRTRSLHGPAPAHLRHARLQTRAIHSWYPARPWKIPRDPERSRETPEYPRETTRNPARSLSCGKGSHVGCPPRACFCHFGVHLILRRWCLWKFTDVNVFPQKADAGLVCLFVFSCAHTTHADGTWSYALEIMLVPLMLHMQKRIPQPDL